MSMKGEQVVKDTHTTSTYRSCSGWFIFTLLGSGTRRGYSSVVEHLTADQEVSSSNLDAPCFSDGAHTLAAPAGGLHIKGLSWCIFHHVYTFINVTHDQIQGIKANLKNHMHLNSEEHFKYSK